MQFGAIVNTVQDTDLVEDAKYVGDASFLSDMPDKTLGFMAAVSSKSRLHAALLLCLPARYRVDPESKDTPCIFIAWRGVCVSGVLEGL